MKNTTTRRGIPCAIALLVSVALPMAHAQSVAPPDVVNTRVGVYQDSKGRWFTGDHTFRIHLPRDIPAANFWSLAVYDNHSRSLIQNETGVASLGSIRGAEPNPDGSVDAYFGPVRPEGGPKKTGFRQSRVWAISFTFGSMDRLSPGLTSPGSREIRKSSNEPVSLYQLEATVGAHPPSLTRCVTLWKNDNPRNHRK